MLDSIASWLVIGLNKFLHIMPMRFNLWLGRRLGAGFYLLSGKRRGVTYSNIKAAFYKEKTPQEIKRLVKQNYRSIMQLFVEIASLTKVNQKYVDKYIRVHNIERMVKAAKNPNGVIYNTAHFGNWELSAVTSMFINFPIHVLTRDQKMEKLNDLLYRVRESKGIKIISKGADVKTIFRVLHKGAIVGIVGDQNAGPNGKLLDLFGRPASTAIGPYRIAQTTGAYILPVFLRRVDGPYCEIYMEEPMKIEKKEDITPYMQRYNDLLEKHVRECPDQWLWMHKKWKMTPVKMVLVLDDGKKGHLKQSLAVVKQIKRHREGRGFKPEHLPVEIVPIRFKTRSRRTVFNLAAPFLTSRSQGRLGWLRWALTPESYADASYRYADVIVSCGSALCGVNRILKIENFAHNLTILDPGPLMRKKFDVIVMPRHDAAKIKGIEKREKVVVTELAPNVVEPAGPAQGREVRPCIGVLIGGENKSYAFGEDLVRSVADGIKEGSTKTGSGYYITTSRRTPEDSERVLEEILANDPRCVGFISGKTDKDEATVEKILTRSNVVVVSGESISMVSEAVSSGKPVLVFMPDKKQKGKTKYACFVKGLEEKGYLRSVEPRDISQTITEVLENKIEFKLPDDDDRICEKVGKLF
ncbi:MAG: mitochondrial fission ELM1 family protein [Candidatus Omnitrophica bacterium]|nr:mitochondrial fission ELM1 family protein [Candidatus Omnitrophota bacterium]